MDRLRLPGQLSLPLTASAREALALLGEPDSDQASSSISTTSNSHYVRSSGMLASATSRPGSPYVKAAGVTGPPRSLSLNRSDTTTSAASAAARRPTFKPLMPLDRTLSLSSSANVRNSLPSSQTSNVNVQESINIKTNKAKSSIDNSKSASKSEETSRPSSGVDLEATQPVPSAHSLKVPDDDLGKLASTRSMSNILAASQQSLQLPRPFEPPHLILPGDTQIALSKSGTPSYTKHAEKRDVTASGGEKATTKAGSVNAVAHESGQSSFVASAQIAQASSSRLAPILDRQRPARRTRKSERGESYSESHERDAGGPRPRKGIDSDEEYEPGVKKVKTGKRPRETSTKAGTSPSRRSTRAAKRKALESTPVLKPTVDETATTRNKSTQIEGESSQAPSSFLTMLPRRKGRIVRETKKDSSTAQGSHSSVDDASQYARENWESSADSSDGEESAETDYDEVEPPRKK